MKKAYLTLLVLACFTLQAQNKLPKLDALVELPPVILADELAKDAQVSQFTKPFRIATPTKLKDVFIKGKNSQGGQWDRIDENTWVWRAMFHADNAFFLDFGFYDFYLPPTAQLSLLDWSGKKVKGPFSGSINKKDKQFWPGPIIGDIVTVELKVSDEYKDFVSLAINNVSRGYRKIWQDYDLTPKFISSSFWLDKDIRDLEKSGSCNVDVVCPEGNDWQNQIKSVGRYTITKPDGTFLCTGQMINNTKKDGKPLFLTANHCGFNSSNDSTINLWWNYESSQCRTPGSSASGNQIPINSFNDTQSGSTYLASFETSDFALLELDSVPNASYGVIYTGWDRRDVAPASAVSIHHPSGHAKRISVENNQTSITSYLQEGAGIRSHIRIADWDIGTTEGGSSGSGLWNPQKLLVGQLHGGYAACGNNRDDWYGRLYRSWTGGGTNSSRLSNWLDPINTGAETLVGLGDTGTCSNLNISISHTSSAKETGIKQTYKATVSGGSGNYTYNWDINADGNSDGSAATINATYSQAFTGNVTVEVSEGESCTGSATIPVVIKAPKIIPISAGDIYQVCGNNDQYADPGERFKISLTMQNDGFSTASNAYAVLTKVAASSSFVAKEQDNYGNTLGDCDKQFIDISSTGVEMTLVDANTNDNFDVNDEGVAHIDLPTAFNLYGKTITHLSLSTNGYISSDAAETGFDFNNDCPIPAMPSSTNIQAGTSVKAKLMPLHNDLITQKIFYQHFNTCPRPSQLGANLACEVFMYQGVDFFNSSNSIVENFNFEAILYPSVNQWVYQYDGADFSSEGASIGLQSDNANDGAGMSCNSVNAVSSQKAVCIFHKNNQPQVRASTATALNIETPVLALGNLAISQNSTKDIIFSIPEDASCGSAVGFDVQASVYEEGFNENGVRVVALDVGNNGACNVVTNCSVNSANDISPVNGLWYNPKRSGNGNDMYFFDDSMIYIQYTALENRAPIWYITGGEGYYKNNQSYNNLLKVSYNGPYSSNLANQVQTVVGESHTTLIDAEHAVQTRTINGKFSADLMEVLHFSQDATPNNRTGIWYSPSQPGWGVTVATQGNTEVLVNYLYDNNGQPYWVLGSGSRSDNSRDLSYFNAFCPHCPSVDVTSSVVGSQQISYSSSENATLNNVSIQTNNTQHPSNWNKNNLSLQNIVPPDSK
ncbi:MAG TPA: hypothetical protein ENJ44_05175 [Oceanospirillales bacterium]|nr:hypothetical protein [Oceanospirillales bacterium]